MSQAKQEWEYNAYPLNMTDTDSVRRILNISAEDGWEVVSIVPIQPPQETAWTVVVLKRRIIA